MTTLKEFEAIYNYDESDLYSLGIGSGVHLDEDVFLRFALQDREAALLTDNSQLINNKYINSIIFDIADINDNIIYENYQSGYLTSLSITKKDNYCTYPILQVREGLACFDDALEQVRNNSIKIVKNNLESKLYYHPTIFDYLYYRLFKGVK